MEIGKFEDPNFLSIFHHQLIQSQSIAICQYNLFHMDTGFFFKVDQNYKVSNN